MRSQKGIAIVSAVFLIVMLSTVALALVSISSSMHQSASLQIREARALNAARAGIEYAAYQEVATGLDSAACNSSTTLNLGGYLVTVFCAGTAHTVKGQEKDVYQLSAVATAGNWGTVGYVRRRVETVLVVD
jgi:MSHA biogenesis protein MshP